MDLLPSLGAGLDRGQPVILGGAPLSLQAEQDPVLGSRVCPLEGVLAEVALVCPDPPPESPALEQGRNLVAVLLLKVPCAG